MEQKQNRIWPVLFVIYCVLMFWLLFARPMGGQGVPYWEQIQQSLNLIPFQTIRRFLRLMIRPVSPSLARHAAINLVGNVLLFIPMGLCLPKLFAKQRHLWAVLLTTAAAITLVELTQLLTLVGSCDIDDLILNVLGAALGYGLQKLLHKKPEPAP